eukprot:TRINITY_DN19424_c0_g1_i4.p1 TRINITY_DN19424_c0_g1~~TRINITY_DN19424_c0_g1_i4.p1  ORF type:complete len:272 (-),score=78.93 TRINITY_DN19424_c0_g1_i4:77-892(-)
MAACAQQEPERFPAQAANALMEAIENGSEFSDVIGSVMLAVARLGEESSTSDQHQRAKEEAAELTASVEQQRQTHLSEHTSCGQVLSPVTQPSLDGPRKVLEMLYAKLARLERMLHGRSDKFRPGVVLEDGLDGFSELHMGTVQGDLKSMAELLVMVPSLVHLEDSQGLTPLHWAALLDNGEAVKLLCEHGGHPDAHGALTPLHLAALMGNPKAIGALGECGAEHSRVVVELGLDAVQLSLQSGQIDAVKAMMELRAAGTGMEEDLSLIHI